MSLTTDPTDQAKKYLVLSEAERAKGFVRPVRKSYVHVGERPAYPLRALTSEEVTKHAGYGVAYVAYEEYPESRAPLSGRFWTQAQLDAKGCGGLTTMGDALAETYAANPSFYGSTYCCSCRMHKPVAEFTWDADGTVVGS